MDQFKLVTPVTPAGAARPPPTGVRAAGVRALRQPGVRLPTSRLGRAPTAPVQAMRLGGLGFEGMPQGVDLSLEEFNLSEAMVVDRETKVGAWAEVIQSSGEVCAEALWKDVKDRGDTDFRLLSAIFNPYLSDRRDDGNLFVPPDTSMSYVRKLQKLVAEEGHVKQQRIEHFGSVDFDSDSPGPLFPTSWTLQIQVAKREASRGAQNCSHPLPQYRAQEKVLLPMLASMQPIFDKRTE